MQMQMQMLAGRAGGPHQGFPQMKIRVMLDGDLGGGGGAGGIFW